MMYDFCAKCEKNLDICKQFSKNRVNEFGNIYRRGVVTKFSDSIKTRLLVFITLLKTHILSDKPIVISNVL